MQVITFGVIREALIAGFPGAPATAALYSTGDIFRPLSLALDPVLAAPLGYSFLTNWKLVEPVHRESLIRLGLLGPCGKDGCQGNEMRAAHVRPFLILC